MSPLANAAANIQFYDDAVGVLHRGRTAASRSTRLITDGSLFGRTNLRVLARIFRARLTARPDRQKETRRPARPKSGTLDLIRPIARDDELGADTHRSG